MIRPIYNEESKYPDRNLDSILGSLVLNPEFQKDTGVIFEYYMRAFGWPDFVVSLYGPNEGLLKSAILKIRDKCKGIITSTIIGVCPEDQFFRISAFRNEKIIENLKKFEDNLEKGSNNAIATMLSLEEAKNYIKMQKELLNTFEKQLNCSKVATEYQSGFETDSKLFNTLMETVFQIDTRNMNTSKEATKKE